MTTDATYSAALGYKHHRRGELRTAAAHYRVALRMDPAHIDARHLLDTISKQLAEHESEPVDSDPEAILERFDPLFHPRGVVIAGASTHPGKFGFVTLHNLLRFGYDGRVFPINRDGADVLGRATFREVAEIPDGEADLVFVCTPNKANVGLLRDSTACRRSRNSVWVMAFSRSGRFRVIVATGSATS